MVITEVTRELTAQDRCDSCSAAAQVVVTFLHGELMFCGHHAKEKRDALIAKSATVFDPNNFLNIVEQSYLLGERRQDSSTASIRSTIPCIIPIFTRTT